MLKIGSKAPAFAGLDQNGDKITLKDFKDKKLILFFYPKDNTPSCTAEACSLRDNYKVLIKSGFSIIGISADTDKSHQKFIAKNNLPFPLIADVENKIIEAFEVWGEKTMYGKKYMGILRTTYIINEKGKIEHVIDKVETKKHAEQILSLYQ